MKKKLVIMIVSSLLVMLMLGSGVMAREYPSKTVDTIVPYAAGGGGDLWGRIMASVAGANFGQEFRVRNIAGAMGMMGWRELLSKPADGYTQLIIGEDHLFILLIEDDPALCPFNDLRVVTPHRVHTTLLMAKPDKPWSTWEGLVEYAKENPGELTLGAAGTYIGWQALVHRQAGIDINYVVYDGTAASISDFLGGHIDLISVSIGSATPLAPDRAVGVMSSDHRRDAELGELFAHVPTAFELGFEGGGGMGWVMVHPNTPEEIVEYFHKAYGDILSDPSALSIIRRVGEIPTYAETLEEAQRMYIEQTDKIREAGKILQEIMGE